MPQKYPVHVHNGNPHCFQFRDEAVKLVTSGEHYGALINGAFDYATYIDELARVGLNGTRLFTFYRELPHHIPAPGRMNTLAPRLEDAIMPYERVAGHGKAADGGDKFDLMRWNNAYFDRLHDIVRLCGEREILVELTVFCNPYDQERYDLFPCSAASNISGVGEGLDHYWQFMTMDVVSLVIWQEMFIAKLVREMNDYDNVYFEACNEPVMRGDRSAEGAQRVIRWQRHVASMISRLEGGEHDPVHMVAVNAHYPIGNAIAKGRNASGVQVVRLDDIAYAALSDVDIINYHYLSSKAVTEGHQYIALPSDGGQAGNTAPFLGEREAWGKAMVMDESYSGIAKGGAERYAINRAEAWEALLGGAAGYNNLDWTFTPADPLGQGAAPIDDGRCLDGRALRDWLGILRRTLESCDIANMLPRHDLVTDVCEGYAATTSESAGRYLVYLADARLYQMEACPEGSAALTLHLPEGRFSLHTMDPRVGEMVRLDDLIVEADALGRPQPAHIETPAFAEDILLILQQIAC